ncbi:MAG: SEC-C metal-binding domain-containing protein [Dehalococcoidia bacterium]|nr:SEC-C metal-binding domain-containing protein [Dehalococcoidia bacterium]
MNTEYIQSKADLELHLQHCVEALKLSCDAFDRGSFGEAMRLAATIRLLVHDTNQSKSLLGQLGKKSAKFYDTSLKEQQNSLISHIGPIGIVMETGTYFAFLDDLPPTESPRWVEFGEWWSGVIFIDKRGQRTTRKDMILAMANQDGGVHVDTQLDQKYASLSRENALGWNYVGPKGEFELKSPVFAAARQVAHEVLKTLMPTMPFLKPKVEGTLTLGARAVISGVHGGPARNYGNKVGRNDPCPCGSGRKYKRCCGANI